MPIDMGDILELVEDFPAAIATINTTVQDVNNAADIGGKIAAAAKGFEELTADLKNILSTL